MTSTGTDEGEIEVEGFVAAGYEAFDLDARASVAYAMNRMADDSATDFRGGILAATALGCASA